MQRRTSRSRRALWVVPASIALALAALLPTLGSAKTPPVPGPHDASAAARAGKAAGLEQVNTVLTKRGATTAEQNKRPSAPGRTTTQAAAAAPAASSNQQVATFRVYATQYNP